MNQRNWDPHLLGLEGEKKQGAGFLGVREEGFKHGLLRLSEEGADSQDAGVSEKRGMGPHLLGLSDKGTSGGLEFWVQRRQFRRLMQAYPSPFPPLPTSSL